MIQMSLKMYQIYHLDAMRAMRAVAEAATRPAAVATLAMIPLSACFPGWYSLYLEQNKCCKKGKILKQLHEKLCKLSGL